VVLLSTTQYLPGIQNPWATSAGRPVGPLYTVALEAKGGVRPPDSNQAGRESCFSSFLACYRLVATTKGTSRQDDSGRVGRPHRPLPRLREDPENLLEALLKVCLTPCRTNEKFAEPPCIHLHKLAHLAEGRAPCPTHLSNSFDKGGCWSKYYFGRDGTLEPD
jgi:hypothetical protein